jgi:DNA-binding transcriptional ArsR family regulator
VLSFLACDVSVRYASNHTKRFDNPRTIPTPMSALTDPPDEAVLQEFTEDAVVDGLERAFELELSAPELDLATVLQALSDPMRLQIVAALADGDEHSCGSFTLPVTKSTRSHHYGVLRTAGVISTRIEGKTRLNRLNRAELDRSFPGLIDAILRVGQA